jgi:hypothetical protein
MEITLYEKMSNPLDAVDRLGVALAKSGMFGCDNENAGKVLAMICMTERKSPVEIMRRFDIIGGKLRTKSMAAFADFRAKGGKVKWLATGEDGKEAKAEFTFEGQTITLGYTIDQAKKAGLVKPSSGWDKNTANMLRARVISNGLGMLCPEIFAGNDGEQQEVSAPTISLTTTVEPVAESSSAQSRTPAQPVVVEAEVIQQPSSPAPLPVTPAVESTPAAELPEEMVVQLEQAIGEHAVAAHKWMLKEGWLKHGQSMANLSPTRAQRVIKQSASFIRAVTGSVS